MAFKILDKEEISLLSDNQRLQYEKELDLYQQRAAFVERLEMLENTTIAPYEPKLKSITVINEIEVEPFKKTEYILSTCEPIAKPELKINPFVKPEQINPVLPIIAKEPDIQVKFIQKPESTQPELPVIAKPVFVEKHFIKSKIKHPDLPKIVKPHIAVKSFKNSERMIETDLPDVSMPSMDVVPFAMPIKTQPSLPEISVRLTKTPAFCKPEQSNMDLPTVVKPDIEIHYLKEEKPILPDLPKVPELNLEVKAAFQKPEQTNAKLPTVVKPTINVPAFVKTNTTPRLPKIPILTVQSKAFSKPEQTEPELPTVAKPTMKVRSFEKINHPVPSLPQIPKLSVQTKSFVRPEHSNPELPIVTRLHVETKTFQRLEKIQPNIVEVQVPNIQIKSFTKLESNILQLPEKSSAKISDANAKVNELILALNEEFGALKG